MQLTYSNLAYISQLIHKLPRSPSWVPESLLPEQGKPTIFCASTSQWRVPASYNHVPLEVPAS
jgi:hypothetical protein